MSCREEFFGETLVKWRQALAQVVGPMVPASMTWRGRDTIRDVLAPFAGSNLNHAHYPTGGGLDWQRVDDAGEAGCLAALVSDRMADIFKPRALTLEYFPEAPIESFLLLELEKLLPSGADEGASRYAKEEVLEYPPGLYLNRDLWEQGYLTTDERGREVPLPPDSRPVTRWFG